jgi:8-amino-3,8-dideoxy-alpha-D-manno-octulosonate transaminase
MPGSELIGSEELAEVQDVFANGGVLYRNGWDFKRNNCYKVQQFEQEFAKHMGVKYALAVTSGTAAIRVALAAIGIKEGDEVITQSFTFIATVEGIIESRATPVCAEIDGTLNLDPEDLLRKITPRTKAVIVVHMLGMPARLPEIAEICRKHNLILIEDTAWGCGGNLQGIPLGTWGDIGTYSFDFMKTITTGEGGMLVFRNEELWKRAVGWHDHGHENKPGVARINDARGDSGFNYRMMELQGAVGLAQLKKLPYIVTSQRNNYNRIWQAISDIPGIELRESPNGSHETADALIFTVADSSTAQRCQQELIKAKIQTKILPENYSWHFAGAWKHVPELEKSHGGNLSTAFPRSHAILSRSISIAINVNMSNDIHTRICSALKKAL